MSSTKTMNELLALIETSPSGHHYWKGKFAYADYPTFKGRRAVLCLWEQAHREFLPRNYTLINECGIPCCVNLEHHRLAHRSEAQKNTRLQRWRAVVEKLAAMGIFV